MKGTEYVCKRWRMMSWLIAQGFKPVEVIPDATNPSFKNWVFKSTEELETAIDTYFSSVVGKGE